MAKAEKPADAAHAKAEKPSFVARIRNLPQWVREHRIKAAVAFSVVFSILGALLFTWAVFEAKRHVAEKESSYTTADALAALDEGNLPDALHIAKLVKFHDNITTGDAGGPAFVFGVAALQRAENPFDINRHHSYRIASYWFDEAYRKGLPESHHAEAAYLCAKTLTLAERYHDALPMLREAASLNPERTGELNRYLALVYFLQPDPDLPAALEAANRFLSSKDATDDGRADTLLLRAEILIRLNRPADALVDLEKTAPDSKRLSESLVLRARCLLVEAIEARSKDDLTLPPTPEVQQRLIQALALIDEALDRDRGLTVATPQASYVAGLIELQRNFIEVADDNFHQAYRRSVDGPEGLASQLQSARLARIRRRTQTAVDLYRAVLEEVGDSRDYHNRWIPLSEMKQEFVAAYDDFYAKQEYAATATLAELFPKLFDEDYAVQLAAESNVAWGKQLGDAALDGPGETSETGEQSRVRYRTAGRLYERLAELRQATREYPEEIWSSANNFLKGAAYADAARQFRRYIEVEPRGRHADALIGLAEVLYVNQRHEQSLVLLKQCLDLYSRDPSVFRARLLLAHIYSEMNQWEPAERTLRDNLESDALTPESEEWRRSLFALGRMLYDVGRYRDAADRLDESVERYPDDVETVEARYRAAESHRRIAQRFEQDIPTDALPAERAKYVHRAETEYVAALERFDETIRVARGPHLRGLDDASRNSLLRNSLFARGSILHAVGRYEDAVRAHQTAIASFPNSPAALDAYLQIVDCYRRLRRGPEARGTLEQAKLMLNRLPQDASFESVSNYTRQEWARLLDTLGSF